MLVSEVPVAVSSGNDEEDAAFDELEPPPHPEDKDPEEYIAIEWGFDLAVWCFVGHGNELAVSV